LATAYMKNEAKFGQAYLAAQAESMPTPEQAAALIQAGQLTPEALAVGQQVMVAGTEFVNVLDTSTYFLQYTLGYSARLFGNFSNCSRRMLEKTKGTSVITELVVKT